MWATTLSSSAIVLISFDAAPRAIAYAVTLTSVGAGVHYYIGYYIPTRVDEQVTEDSR